MNTIFELVEIFFRDKKPKYPEFEVRSRHVGYFSSLDIAEQALKERIVDFKKWKIKSFGFQINELPLDKSTFSDAKSRRIYLPDGGLLDETLVSEIPEEEGDFERFTGRPADKIRFNIGDLVEVLYRDKVILEIVGNLPWMTTENVPPYCDYVDDCYYTLDQLGEHSHPASVRLFPARLKVSKALKQKFLNDEYLSYRAYFDNQKETQQKENLK